MAGRLGPEGRFSTPLEPRVGPQLGPWQQNCPGPEAKGLICRTFADVAQLVEHFTRNEGVPGSSPGVGLVTNCLLKSRFRLSGDTDWECSGSLLMTHL